MVPDADPNFHVIVCVYELLSLVIVIVVFVPILKETHATLDAAISYLLPDPIRTEYLKPRSLYRYTLLLLHL